MGGSGSGACFAFTTTASTSYADIEYRPGDVFMFGPESVGLPAEVQQDPHVSERVKIPMKPGRRSLNLANSASIAIFEAWRQNGFEEAPSSMAATHHNLPEHLVQQILETAPPWLNRFAWIRRIGSSRSRVGSRSIRRPRRHASW